MKNMWKNLSLFENRNFQNVTTAVATMATVNNKYDCKSFLMRKHNKFYNLFY